MVGSAGTNFEYLTLVNGVSLDSIGQEQQQITTRVDLSRLSLKIPFKNI